MTRMQHAQCEGLDVHLSVCLSTCLTISGGQVSHFPGDDSCIKAILKYLT